MDNDPYFITEAEEGFGLCLVIKGPWSDNYIDIIRENKISVLRLSESMGWSDSGVSFLEKLKYMGLRGVEIYSWNVKDLTFLSCLPELEYIGIQCEFNKAPDFSSFIYLTHLFLPWRPKAKTIFECFQLKYLNIVNFPFEDLQDLKKITKLTRLQITSKKLVSTSGIENLQNLRGLDLAGCQKLKIFAGIENCKLLQVIELENCKQMYDISSLGNLADLRSVVLTDCGKVKSLRPLARCKMLKSLIFVGDTNVEDGELTPLLSIPGLTKMWFMDRRHYSHKRDQVAAILS